MLDEVERAWNATGTNPFGPRGVAALKYGVDHPWNGVPYLRQIIDRAVTVGGSAGTHSPCESEDIGFYNPRVEPRVFAQVRREVV